MNRIRTGDTVIFIAGKSKGYIGKVIKALRQAVVVEGGNLIKKHVKPNPNINEKGGIISRESPVDISNVAIYNPQTKKADKVGFKFIEKNGEQIKVRYFKSNDELIDLI
jgi:large subunit ribosomal protein L24